MKHDEENATYEEGMVMFPLSLSLFSLSLPLYSRSSSELRLFVIRTVIFFSFSIAFDLNSVQERVFVVSFLITAVHSLELTCIYDSAM